MNDNISMFFFVISQMQLDNKAVFRHLSQKTFDYAGEREIRFDWINKGNYCWDRSNKSFVGNSYNSMSLPKG